MHIYNDGSPQEPRQPLDGGASLPLIATNEVARDDDEVRRRIGQLLRAQFGSLVHDIDGAHVVSFPGSPYAVLVATFRSGNEAMVSVSSPAALDADWSPGLSDYLLRENDTLVLARFSRVEDSVIVGYEFPALTTSHTLVHAVMAVAQLAARTHAALRTMGALTLPPDD